MGDPADSKSSRRAVAEVLTAAGRRRGGAAPSLDLTLLALADPTRRAVIGILLDGPSRPADIAERLGVSRPALTRHLRILRQSKLLVERPVADDARGRLCVLNPAALGGLHAWLDRIERMWGTQLNAFKRYAEAAVLKRDRSR